MANVVALMPKAKTLPTTAHPVLTLASMFLPTRQFALPSSRYICLNISVSPRRLVYLIILSNVTTVGSLCCISTIMVLFHVKPAFPTGEAHTQTGRTYYLSTCYYFLLFIQFRIIFRNERFHYPISFAYSFDAIAAVFHRSRSSKWAEISRNRLGSEKVSSETIVSTPRMHYGACWLEIKIKRLFS